MMRCAVVLTLLAFAACSSGAEVRRIGGGDLPQELYGESTRRTVEPRTARMNVFFVRTEPQTDPTKPARFLTPARLGAVEKQVRTRLPMVEAATRLLLEGPSPAERRDGFSTVIEANTELLGISVRRRVADVNLSAEFESVTSQLGHVMRLAQVVWTLTDLADVDAVRFRIHGVAQSVIDQNGVAHAVVGQGRYSRFAPLEGGSLVEESAPPVATSAP